MAVRDLIAKVVRRHVAPREGMKMPPRVVGKRASGIHGHARTRGKRDASARDNRLVVDARHLQPVGPIRVGIVGEQRKRQDGVVIGRSLIVCRGGHIVGANHGDRHCSCRARSVPILDSVGDRIDRRFAQANVLETPGGSVAEPGSGQSTELYRGPGGGLR